MVKNQHITKEDEGEKDYTLCRKKNKAKESAHGQSVLSRKGKKKNQGGQRWGYLAKPPKKDESKENERGKRESGGKVPTSKFGRPAREVIECRNRKKERKAEKPDAFSKKGR